ncbi:cytochrome c biogenesis protein ResB [Bradyrhizobium sp. RT4b]
MVLGVVVLIILLAIAFAAGYFTRDHVSRKRRAEARRWREYSEPDWLRAAAPANTNEIANTNAAATGELGQMLDRWESRARARRAG